MVGVGNGSRNPNSALAMETREVKVYPFVHSWDTRKMAITN